MLRELRIRNIAIIDELTLRPSTGLNVLSGETGAGKSIIVDALELALGAPAPATALREGASNALIEAQFELAPDATPELFARLEEEGLRDEEAPDSLTLARILRGGRSSARVNGLQVALPLLREIAAALVDIHGQSEHLSLLRPAQHLLLLDCYAGLEDERADFARQLVVLRETQREAATTERDWQQARRDRERWREDLAELEAATLSEGEEEDLRAERERLGNREQLAEHTAAALAFLGGEERADAPPAAADGLARAAGALARVANLDATGREMAERAERLGEEANELLGALLRYREGLEYEPQRLQEIEERLEVIRRCLRRFGGSVEAARAHEATARAALARADAGNMRWRQLREKAECQLRALGKQAAELSEKRGQAAATLRSAIEVELAQLGMAGARFAVLSEQQEDEAGCPLPDGRICRFGRDGIDRITFTLSANPGEAPRPLAQVASGGETARIMLALKGVLAAADPTPTLIFDEIDQGIGGRMGAVVGARLRDLAREGHQVLVVTHLAQLAAYADAHFVASKAIVAERTVTRAHDLETDKARVAELATMLGADTQTGRQNAAELLAGARAG